MRTGNDGFKDHGFGTLYLDASFVRRDYAKGYKPSGYRLKPVAPTMLQSRPVNHDHLVGVGGVVGAREKRKRDTRTRPNGAS